MIEESLRSVCARIDEACRRCGRDPTAVTLVAVTKAVGAPEVLELARLGQRVFGENRVQEAERKCRELAGQPFQWHLIGHLQRNKVPLALRLFSMIHSVDSERLAAEIEKEAAKLGRTVPVLIEVNLSGEATKYGVTRPEAPALARTIAAMPHVHLQGLMTMAPLVEDPDQTRPVFRALKDLLEELRALALPNADLRHLSMGMTQDFEVAVEEGATLVRIGTALFG